MGLLYIINLIVAALLPFWMVWFSRRKLKLAWVNPLTIMAAITAPVEIMKLFGGPWVLIENGLFERGYQYAVYINNVNLVAQVLGALFFFRLAGAIRMDKIAPFQNIFVSPAALIRTERIFLFVFAASLFILASAEFGIFNWMKNPREGYQFYRTAQGHWYALAVSSLSVACVSSFLACPRPRSVLFNTFLYIFLGYFLGSKGILLALICWLFVFLWFLRWKYLGLCFLAGMPLLFLLLAYNLYLALTVDFNVRAIFEYFDYYKNAADYYNEYLDGALPLYFGEVFVSSFWAYVPRALWPEKPVIYGILLVNEHFFPGLAALTSTPAFGGAVEQFADFGVFGVIVFGFFSSDAALIGLLSYLTFRSPGVRFDRVSLLSALLMLVQYGPGFGKYFPAGLYCILLVAVLIVFRLARKRLIYT